MNAPLQRSPEWFVQRISMITASRSGDILGTQAERNAVMRDMVREYLDEEKEFKGNADTERGVIHEPDAIMALEMETGLLVNDCPFITHPEVQWMGASPDGVASDNANVEAKCPRRIKPISDKPKWWHQAQHQMFCTGRKRTYFIQWTAEGHQVDVIEADEGWFDKHGLQLEAFYNEYLDTIADPKKCQSHIDPLTNDMSDNEAWMKAATEAQYIKSQMEQLKKRQDELKAQFIELAADHKSSGGGVSVFSTSRQGSVNTKKLIADGIDVEAYRGKPTISWTMTVTAK